MHKPENVEKKDNPQGCLTQKNTKPASFEMQAEAFLNCTVVGANTIVTWQRILEKCV